MDGSTPSPTGQEAASEAINNGEGNIAVSEARNSNADGVAAANVEPASSKASLAHSYLRAVALRADSLDMAVRYAGMRGVGQQSMPGENGDENWNVLLPQVMDVIGVSSITICS